jgi:hypothetical protein
LAWGSARNTRELRVVCESSGVVVSDFSKAR